MFLRQSFCSLVLLSALGIWADAAPEEPQRDRYGDPLPEGAIARLGSIRLRNEELIFSAVFMADGKTLATAGAGSISFWDSATGKLARRVEIKNAAPNVRVGRLSGDGKTLIYSLSDYRNVVYVVDASSGAQLRTLSRDQGGSIVALDISRDGKVLAVASFSSIALWDVPAAKLLHEFKGPLPRVLSPRGVIALTPDGKQLVLPHADGSLHLVDVASGKELRALEMPPLRVNLSSSSRIERLSVSPDGRYLAFSGMANPLTVCELATGKRLHELAPPQAGFFSGAAFTPNSRVLAVDDSTGIRLFDVPSGKEIRKITMSAGMNNLLFSPDGRTLVLARGYTIRFWDMSGERWLHPLIGHEGGIRSLTFFPDGKRLVSASTGMRVWDIASGQTLAQRTIPLSESPAVDRDGESVRYAGYDTSVHHWDPRTDREEVQRRVVAGLSTNRLTLSPDGRSLAVLTINSSGVRQKRTVTYQVRLYDVKTGKFVELPGVPPPDGVAQILFAPDSRRLAVRSYRDVVRLWDRDTGKLVRELKSETPKMAGMHLTPIFAADGRTLLTSINNLLRIRECAGGAVRLQIPVDPQSMNVAAYAPDARFLACGHRDGRIQVYSALSGKPLARWQGKQGITHALAFSRDGRLLASGGANGTILVWKVPEDDSVPVVRNAGEAESLWQALGDSDAANANRALAGLAAAPAQALPFFKERLHPIDKQLDERLARLIAELDDDSFKVREQATRELASIGAEAADALRQALSNYPSAEVKRRIEDLLARLKKGGHPERLRFRSERLRFLRALEVLERIGSPQAKELLRELAGKPMADELREEVQASLRRMGDKP